MIFPDEKETQTCSGEVVGRGLSPPHSVSFNTQHLERLRKVRSRRGAIQIHVYLYLYLETTPGLWCTPRSENLGACG